MNLLVGDRRIGGVFMFQDIEQLFDEINAKSNNFDNLKNIKNDDNSDDDTSSGSSFNSLKNISNDKKKDKESMDDLFDSLSIDVSGATSFINNVMDAKEELNKDNCYLYNSFVYSLLKQ